MKNILIVAFIAASLITSQTIYAQPQQGLPAGEDALVARVIDGDTIEVRVNDTRFTVRYIGIDAPETKGAPAQTCLSRQATAANRALVQGKTLRLEKDVSEFDKYGRLLRYAYLPDGTMINKQLVLKGFALAATYPPDVKYVDQLAAAQGQARESNAGLWSKCPQLVAAIQSPVLAATAAPQPQVQAQPQAPAQETPLQTGNAAGGVAPVNSWTCPESHSIKGNRNSMIYHTTASRHYDKTKPEVCFSNEADAVAAGFRPPKR
jgi:micrococcal nuclease